MFMFRRKRTSLAKRLWRARIRTTEHEFIKDNMGCCAFIDELNFCSDEGLLRNSLIKRLKDNQLEILVNAVETRGANTSCVLYPREYVDNPHLMTCQIWRWPDINHVDEIKRLPCCESAKDLVYECINPYHFSRLCYPESPPPPYCRFSAERLKPEEKKFDHLPDHDTSKELNMVRASLLVSLID
ncbi:unnamed protein product [Bemisia tabaci]|uniref:MH1 domain-containing protein n=1 Tax=Bemisia tabaci TaxID=7038 RepID=A0A9P0AB48_BEMTA|nr:unnamed protein product [Bemisia tabaci]